MKQDDRNGRAEQTRRADGRPPTAVELVDELANQWEKDDGKSGNQADSH